MIVGGVVMQGAEEDVFFPSYFSFFLWEGTGEIDDHGVLHD